MYVADREHGLATQSERGLFPFGDLDGQRDGGVHDAGCYPYPARCSTVASGPSFETHACGVLLRMRSSSLSAAQRPSLSRMKSRTRGMICSRHLRPLKMP